MMVYGKALPTTRFAFILASVLCPFLAATHAAHAVPTVSMSKRSPAKTPLVSKSKNVHPGLLASIDADTLQVTLADGSVMEAGIKPKSVFLQNGVNVAPTAFIPGRRVVLRVRVKASDDTNSVVLLCDPASAAAIEAYRGKTLVGEVVAQDDNSLVVQPSSETPLTLRVTAKTSYFKAGADAVSTAFPVGSTVAVITRGLPSGLLMASIVSDSAAAALAEKAELKPVSLVGSALDVQAPQGLLTIAPKTKPRQTVAVTDSTKIKVDKAEAMLAAITPGMRVSAHLGHAKDAAGHTIATSLSAYTVTTVTATRKKKVVAAKAP